MSELQELFLFIKTLGQPRVFKRIKLLFKTLLIILFSFLGKEKQFQLPLHFNKQQFLFTASRRLDISILYEIFVTEEYKHKTIPNTSSVLDLGSNIGASSCYFALLYPEAKIVSLEANPEIFEQTKRNCSEFKNITVLNKAISDKENEIIPFYVNESHLGSSLLKSKGGRKVEAVSTSLESLVHKNGDRFDLVKFDIEGAEENIFTNSAENFSRNYIGEVHYDLMKKDQKTFLGLFESFLVSEKKLKKERYLLLAREDSR